MALQLPEPDFYTLAEVAERFGVSEDVLRRLALEGKVKCFFSLTEADENTDSGWDDERGDVREYYSKKSFRFHASEIHRIEHQHEAVEKAAADDVLGTKEKEKLQGIIAAMAQILASKSHAYKNGDNPNAHAIAEAVVETGLVDRAVGTVQKEIGTACTWAKKWSGK